MSNSNDQLDSHNKLLNKLIKRRNKAFLIGWTKRIVILDRRIAELELEIDDLMFNH